MGSRHKPAIDLLYGLNERPPWGRTILYGLQWLIIFLPLLTMVSFLAAQVMGFSHAAKLAFFQRLLIVTGATIVLQTLWGHRLPTLDGPAMALVVTLATLTGTEQSSIGGGMIFGGFLLFLCGALGLMRYLIPLFTDRVIGVVLILIGLSAAPYLLPMLIGVDPQHPHGQKLVMALGFVLIIVMALMTHHLEGLLRSLSIFMGVILGAVIFGALGMLDLSEVRSAPWASVPDLGWLCWPKFDPASCLAFALAYLAVLVNTMGSLYTVESIVSADNISGRLNRGLVLTGLSGVLAGAAGVIGTVPYSNSPGIIAVTRVGSRYALTACGLILLVMAFVSKLNALFAAVPDAVVAAALVTGVAVQIGVGMDVIHRQTGRLSSRDYLIVGLSILLGVIAGMLPPEFMAQLPKTIKPLLSNGLIVGVVLVLLLEHVILAEKK